MASAPLAEVGDDSSQLKSIHERFVAIPQGGRRSRRQGTGQLAGREGRYQAEMDRLASATGVEARAWTILRVRYEKTSESVDIAWPFLTTEDVDPIRLMLVNNTHLQDARDADAEEKRAEETVDERAKRLGLPQFTSFRLRSIAGGQLSVGVAGLDVSSFQFEEVGPNGRSATLRFAGGGGSVGIEAGGNRPRHLDRLRHTETHADGVIRRRARQHRRGRRLPRRRCGVHRLITLFCPAVRRHRQELGCRVRARWWRRSHRGHMDGARAVAE